MQKSGRIGCSGPPRSQPGLLSSAVVRRGGTDPEEVYACTDRSLAEETVDRNPGSYSLVIKHAMFRRLRGRLRALRGRLGPPAPGRGGHSA